MEQRKKIDYSMMKRVTEISEGKMEQKELINAMKKALYLEVAIVIIGMGIFLMMAILCSKM